MATISNLKAKLFILLLGFSVMGAAIGDPTNYDRSLANTLISEGGPICTNHPADPGGSTKYGITIHDVRMYIDKNATSACGITLEQAKLVYRIHYWDAVHGDELPKGLDYSVFDYAVNAGTGRALPTLRICQGKHPGNVPAQIRCVNDMRYDFQINQLGSRFNVFKKGWANRIRSVRAISLQMAGMKVDKGLVPNDLYLIPRVGLGKAYSEER